MIQKILLTIFLSVLLFVSSISGVTVTLNPIADAHGRSGKHADENFGSNDIIPIKNCGSGHYTRKAFFKFDLSSIGIVESATFRLKTNMKEGGVDFFCYYVSDDSWTEESLTWNNMPEAGQLLSEASANDVGEWTDLSISPQIFNEVNEDGILTIMLTAEDCSNYSGFSNDHETPGNRPQLEITHTDVEPGAPENLMAFPGNGLVELIWDENSENDLDGYNMYRSGSPGSGYSKINASLLNSPEYTDEGLSNGTTYYYVVTAVDMENNESDHSNEVSATPALIDTVAPSAPANFSTIIGDNLISLEWDNNSEIDLTGYNVYRSTTQGDGYSKINSSLLTNSDYIDNSITIGTTYYYVVTAVDDSANESDFSVEDSITAKVFTRLVAHYPFNGNTNDVARGNNGAINGEPQYVTGKDGQALEFDGNDDYVNVSSNDDIALTEMTLSAWVYIPGSIPSGWRAIVEHDRSGNNWYGLFKSGNGNFFHFRWANGSGRTDFNSPVSGDTWYHIVGTYDGNTAKMYLNGILDKSLTSSDSPSSTTSGMRIGANMEGNEYFDGIVDDVRIYEVALDESEIFDLYNSYFNPVPSEPANLNATAYKEKVILDWNDNAEIDLSGYNLYRSTTSGSGFAKINDALIDTSECSDTTVVQETTYYYVVTAVDIDANESDYSKQVAAKPSDDIRIITASAGAGGSISPSGQITTMAGNDLSFDFMADQGYRVKDVLIDGDLVDAANSYTFKDISVDHTISVTFEISKIGGNIYFATPNGAGNQDGLNLENAIKGDDIESFINTTMSPGDKLLLDDNGSFFNDLQINISKGGLNEGNRITIEGLDNGDGCPLLKGPGTSSGLCFSINNSVSFLTIKNLKIEDYDRAILVKKGNAPDEINQHMLFDGLEINNVYRGLYLNDFRNSVIKNCKVTYHIKSGIRFEKGCQDVDIVDCLTDHNLGDYSFPSDWAIGFRIQSGRIEDDPLDQTNLTFIRCEARNCVEKEYNPDYWNGDGFLVNDKHQNIRFISCIAYGNADGGWDNKGKDVYFENCIAVQNGRNFRNWHSATFVNCLAVNPERYPGSPSGGSDNWWLDGKWGDAVVDLYNCTSHDGNIGSSDHVVKLNVAENCIFSQSSDDSRVASGSNNIYTDAGDPNYKSPSDDYDGHPMDAYNSQKYGPDQGYWYAEGNQPDITQISATPDNGDSPLEVKFSAVVNDPDGDDNAITYSWDFGDGSSSTEKEPVHTFDTPGNYDVILIVKDENYLTAKDSVSVEVTGNYPPIVSFVNPGNQQMYFVNTPVDIEVNVTDPDGTVDSVSFYNNGVLLITDEQAPYEYTIPGLPEGEYIIEAIAFDDEQTPGSNRVSIVSAIPLQLSEISWQGQVDLSWKNNITGNLTGFGQTQGYNLYRSTTSGEGYTKLNNSLIDTTVYTDNDVSSSGMKYYYVVTAVDEDGNESGYSNEVEAMPQVYVNINAADDAFVRSGDYGDDNYGSEDYLLIKNEGRNWERLSFIKFDLSSLSSILKASLRIKTNDIDAIGHSVKCYLATDDDWTEESLTWNSKPDTSALLGIAVIPGSQSWIEFDLTSQVQAEMSGDGSITLALQKLEPGNPGCSFHSKEAAGSGDRPVLAVIPTESEKFNISAEAGNGGSIEPAGDVAVFKGYDQTFTMIPDNGFVIEDVLVDNDSQGPVNTYTFSDVTGNHTISATFAQIPTYTINASAGEGGAIDPNGEVVINEGDSHTFSIIPNSGYVIDDVMVDNDSKGPIASYTFSDVDADHSINATFAQIPTFTITASAGEGGAIDPDGEVVVNQGDKRKFIITPENGYAISDVKVDGSSVGAVSEYEFTDVSGDHSIEASFEIINSISVVQSKGVFQLYPNPAKDKFTISSSGHLFRVEVYSMNGCLIKTCRNLNGEKVIHSNELNGPGVYMLKIFTNDKLEMKKLIIQ